MNAKTKAFWEKTLAEQHKWIEKCGGDLAGYIANYNGKYRRTVEDATKIYHADMAELKRLQEMLGVAPKPQTPVPQTFVHYKIHYRMPGDPYGRSAKFSHKPDAEEYLANLNKLGATACLREVLLPYPAV